MSDVTTLPVQTQVPAARLTKRVIHRWGSQVGDTTEYTVGRQGNRAWIAGRRVDLDVPVELMRAILAAAEEVLDHDPV